MKKKIIRRWDSECELSQTDRWTDDDI